MDSDDFNDTASKANPDLAHAPFPTKDKLVRLIAERNNALSRMLPVHKPSWALNVNDDRRKEYRVLARAAQRTETRLDKATQKLRHDFDLNS